MMCPSCDFSFPEIEPRSFSFNSPYGACSECNGLGKNFELSEDLIIPDKNKTIGQGGILPWNFRSNNWYGMLIEGAAKEYKIPLNDRIKDIPEYKLNKLIYGEEDPIALKVRSYSKLSGSRYWTIAFPGLINYLDKRYRETESEKIRKDLQKYMHETKCKICLGARLKKESLYVKIGGKNISEVTNLSVNQAIKFFQKLKLSKSQQLIASRINKEVTNRLTFLQNVGLGYLTLDRSANTLSGGESQRIRLASQVGAGLVGVIYILDEPSIGLHAKDNDRLLKTLTHLRDLDNTVIVIEHDEETMLKSDWLVDIGPGAGEAGGKIVENGPSKEVLKSQESLTVKYLTKKLKIDSNCSAKTEKKEVNCSKCQ